MGKKKGVKTKMEKLFGYYFRAISETPRKELLVLKRLHMGIRVPEEDWERRIEREWKQRWGLRKTNEEQTLLGFCAQRIMI